MGRNLDFPALGVAHRASVVAVIEPDGYKPVVSVSWPGMLGSISGMNSDGLSHALMLVYGHTRSDHLRGVPFAIHYRSVLEECENVAQASERFRAREFGVCNNVMLADASRDAAVMELHTKSVGELRDDSDFPVLYCTNHFRGGARKYSFAWTIFSSLPRLLSLRSTARKRISVGEAMDADDVKQAIQRVAVGGVNLQRIIYYPERLEIEVAFGDPTSGKRKYTHFKREQLFQREGVKSVSAPK